MINYTEMSKNHSNKESIASKQRTLICSLEGIGDILVFETKRQKNKLVLGGLEKISDSVKKLFEIQSDDPERFEQLVVSQEFLELYRKDEKEAQFRLSLDSEKYLVGFSTSINQITRIYEAAVDSQNEEISRFAVYHINWILAALAHKPGNDLFVEQVLGKLAQITRIAVRRGDRSMYAAGIHWYTNIVFDQLGRKEKQFDLNYLGLFDKYFFSTVRYIIAENQSPLFQTLISTLVDGVHVPSYHRGAIWDYGHMILRSDLRKYNELDAEYGIEGKIGELAHSEDDLDTKDKLDEWLRKFDEVKAVLERHLTKDQRQQAEKLNEEINEYVVSQFKYNNLLEMVFAFGAYCLFKQRPSYVKYLWEYKQPPDSDAIWIGHDITPRTLEEAVRFYFRKVLFEKKFDFWEEHHGSEKYYKEYFLLLLVRVLQNVRADSDGNFLQIVSYRLPDLNVHRLSDLSHSMDGFVQLADELKQAKTLLAELGIDTGQIDEIFDLKLKPFLMKVKEEADKQISEKHKTQKISAKKIQEFKNSFLKTFYESATLRSMFTKYLSAYENQMDLQIKGQENRLGISVVDDKASFFDEWHIHFVGWGENYARDLALGEDSYLLDEIAKGCEEISPEGLDSALRTLGNPSDIVILATSPALWQFFEESNKFKAKWHRDSEQLDIQSFGGWYEFNGHLIPVLETRHQQVEKQVLILAKSKSGRLIQRSPLNEGEDTALVTDIFYMNIRSFSEDPELMQSLLEKPPEWLQKIGDAQDQRNHLRERVLIQIFERFEFTRDEKFKGYKLLLEA